MFLIWRTVAAMQKNEYMRSIRREKSIHKVVTHILENNKSYRGETS